LRTIRAAASRTGPEIKGQKEVLEEFAGLPKSIQKTARERFALWRVAMRFTFPSFKELRPGLWSVGIN